MTHANCLRGWLIALTLVSGGINAKARELLTSAQDTVAVAWVQRLQSGVNPAADWSRDVAVDKAGNVFVTGSSERNGSAEDYITIKYNPTGGEEWVADYDGPASASDIATAIAVDGGGNVYVTGRSAGSGTGNDYATIKYNASGVQRWVARYDGSFHGDDEACDIVVDVSGNIFVTGSSASGWLVTDYVTIKYNAAGEEQWVAPYWEAAARAMAIDGEGNVYVTGQGAPTSFDPGYVTVKYSPSGLQQWAAIYDGPSEEYELATGIVVDDSGNVVVTGQSDRPETSTDYATVKYNASGQELWVARYNGLANDRDEANAVCLDKEGNIYVTGSSVGTTGGDDFATVKYNPSGGEEWVAVYDGPGNDWDLARAIVVDESGNVYVTGQSPSSQSAWTGDDWATIKYNGVGVEQWVARYDGPGNALDRPAAMALDAAGNLIVTGASRGSQSLEDYATIKYSASGVPQWVSRYDGPGISHDRPVAMVVDESGAVYITGRSYASQSYDDYFTVKYGASGSEEWTARHNGPGNGADASFAVAVDASGNAYVTGASGGTSGTSDFATIKYGPTGTEEWVVRYDGPGHSSDDAVAVGVDQAGNVYVSGQSKGAQGDWDFATVKYNAAGVEQWVARYDGADHLSDLPHAAVVDGAGNVYVTGRSQTSLSPNYTEFATVKYTTDGVQEWAIRYAGPAEPRAIAVDLSGNVYVTGWVSSAAISQDYLTIKYTATGQEVWAARYNGPAGFDDEPRGIAVDALGNVYVTGKVSSQSSAALGTIKYNSEGVMQWVDLYDGPDHNAAGANDIAVDGAGNAYVLGAIGDQSDIATLKYTREGTIEWLARYSSPGDNYDYPASVAVDNSGAVYVNGQAPEGQCVTIKYVQRPASVDGGDVEVAHTFLLDQNYPNPFNPSTTIKYELPKSSMVKLIVYDLLGREVSLLVNERRDAGVHKVRFDGSNLASGVYFYRLQAGDFVQAKRLVIAK